MTLINIETGKEIKHVPYAAQFEAVRRKLSPEEFEAIVARINELIDGAVAKSGKELATAGWLPGGDWSGTPFEPIYSKATAKNYDLSARFFGQAVWYAVMKRPERWASGRYQLDGREIGSRTYFRIA